MALKFLTPIDMSLLEVLNLRLQNLASDPGSPVKGQVWLNSSSNTIKFYDGSAIQTLGVAGAGGDADTLDGLDSTYFLARDNHTGVQAIATVDGLQAALDGKVDDSQVGAANGVASLDGSGVIPTAQLPPLAISDVYVVADVTARDALTVQEGDVAKVTGTNQTFIYDGTDWVELTASDAVQSVNGETGTVVLTTGDVAEDTDARYVTDAQEAKLDSLPSGPLSFAQDVGDGAATAIAVTHSLNTRDVRVEVYRTTSPWDTVLVDVERTDVDTVTLRFAIAPATDAFRCLVAKV